MRMRVFSRSRPITVTARRRALLNFTSRSHGRLSPHRCKTVFFTECWAVALCVSHGLLLVTDETILFSCSNCQRGEILTCHFEYVPLSPSFCFLAALPLGLNWRRCHQSQRSRRSQKMRWNVSLCPTSSNPFMTWMWSRERRLCSNVKWLVCRIPPSSGSTMANGWFLKCALPFLRQPNQVFR